MSTVLICRGFANGMPCAVEGLYLQSFDPDLPASRPLSTWTGRLSRAKRFKDKGEAFDCWRAVRTIDPVRPDGQPNRPLTAFNIELVEVSYGPGDGQQSADAVDQRRSPAGASDPGADRGTQ